LEAEDKDEEEKEGPSKHGVKVVASSANRAVKMSFFGWGCLVFSKVDSSDHGDNETEPSEKSERIRSLEETQH